VKVTLKSKSTGDIVAVAYVSFTIRRKTAPPVTEPLDIGIYGMNTFSYSFMFWNGINASNRLFILLRIFVQTMLPGLNL
jgi:hypothetical protein